MEGYVLLILSLVPPVCAIGALLFYVIYRNRKRHDENSTGLSGATGPGGYSARPALGIRPKDRFLTDGAEAQDEYDDLIERLEYLFESEKIFLEPDIRISDVADKLSTTKNHLSKAIGIKTGKNFCQLLHAYRVREAMRLYTANQKLTISQLCKMVGFNSMTTFNTAFGRNTGYTPAEWCKNFRKNLKNGSKK